MSVWHFTEREGCDILCHSVAKVVQTNTNKLPLLSATTHHILGKSNQMDHYRCLWNVVTWKSQNWDWPIFLHLAFMVENFPLYLDCPAGFLWCQKTMFGTDKWNDRHSNCDVFLRANEGRVLQPLRWYLVHAIYFPASSKESSTKLRSCGFLIIKACTKWQSLYGKDLGLIAYKEAVSQKWATFSA